MYLGTGPPPYLTCKLGGRLYNTPLGEPFPRFARKGGRSVAPVCRLALALGDRTLVAGAHLLLRLRGALARLRPRLPQLLLQTVHRPAQPGQRVVVLPEPLFATLAGRRALSPLALLRCQQK